MNKFDSFENRDFKLVKSAIQGFAKNARLVLDRRTTCGLGHWAVPLGRNNAFVGREHLLATLLAKIPPGTNPDDCQRTVMKGLGGVGKTQIALEAAYRLHRQDPGCSVFWVPAVDATSFENAYRQIGQKLEIRGIDEDKVDVKVLVKAALSRDDAGRWLLIVDNADDKVLLFSRAKTPASKINNLPSIAPLEQYLPFSRHGSILFTTRNHKVAMRLAGTASIIPIPEMERTESRALLETNLDSCLIGNNESIQRLLDLLVDLPLAIKQAWAFMKANGTSVRDYLQIYQENSDTESALLSEEFYDEHRQSTENAVNTTWLISFRYITELDPLAAEYLRYICFFAEKDIPRYLLPSTTTLRTEKAIGTLTAYAFLTKRDGNSYDIHRLVQIAARTWLKANGEWQAWATKALRWLAEVFPLPEHENRQVWIGLLPHAQHILQFRKDIAYGEEAEQTLEDLLFKVGKSFDLLGKYDEAEAMLREAWQLYDTVLGRDHPSTLGSMNNLALVHRRLGRYDEVDQMRKIRSEVEEDTLSNE